MFFKSKKNTINFLCLRCDVEFDINVGKINFDTEDGTPEFENPIVCKKCGAKYIGKDDNISENFELTEVGQSQLTELSFQ